MLLDSLFRRRRKRKVKKREKGTEEDEEEEEEEDCSATLCLEQICNCLSCLGSKSNSLALSLRSVSYLCILCRIKVLLLDSLLETDLQPIVLLGHFLEIRVVAFQFCVGSKCCSSILCYEQCRNYMLCLGCCFSR